MNAPTPSPIPAAPTRTNNKTARPSAHDKAAAEAQKALEANRRARELQAEADRYLNLLVGRVLRQAAKSDPEFAQRMKAKLRAAKLTRREAAEIRHLTNES